MQFTAYAGIILWQKCHTRGESRKTSIMYASASVPMGLPARSPKQESKTGVSVAHNGHMSDKKFLLKISLTIFEKLECEPEVHSVLV